MIKKIVYSDNIQSLYKFINKKGLKCSLIIADEDGLMDKWPLHGSCFIEKISLPAFSNQQSFAFEKAYIASIAELSCKYSSPVWWANSLSEKNEHLSKLYTFICIYYKLIKILQDCKTSNVAVYGNKALYVQLKDYCRIKKIAMLYFGASKYKRITTGIFRGPLHIFRILRYLAIKMIHKLYTDITLKKKLFQYIKTSKNIYTIRSWVSTCAFKTADSYTDTFFGSLPAYLKTNGYAVVILAGIMDDYFKILKLCSRMEDFLIVPEELFLNYLDYFKAAFICFFKKIQLKEHIRFMDVDFTKLYRAELKTSYTDLAFYNNLLKYFIGKRLSEKGRFHFYLQTFENYAWEKMMLLGLRENITTKTDAHIFGFQHAFITRNSFKYFPGELESKIMPLPDRIITLGAVTKNILKEYGEYNGLDIRVGCALRQEYLKDLKPLPRGTLRNILVPLTMNNDESVKIISFLYESGIGTKDYKIVIRCHPLSAFELFKGKLPFFLPQNFIISDKKNVEEDLLNSGVVIYTWSTVALEGLKLGIPLVYLDIAKPMYVDPLFQCIHLKWVVDTPGQLIAAIEEIYNMSDGQFLKEKSLASEYLKEYFYPVDSEHLKVFIDK